MSADTLRNLLYPQWDSPDLLLEAYKRGCVDERAAAKLRTNPEEKRLKDILLRNGICTVCGETTFDRECTCHNIQNTRGIHGHQSIVQ